MYDIEEIVVMGVAERKVREKQRRLNDILDAAEEVFFAADGLQASMDDVAKKAEVSKGTLYIYFKNKKSLYLGIGARANAVVHEMFQSVLDDSKSGIEQMMSLVDAYYEFSQNYPNYFKIKSLSDGMTAKAFQEDIDDPLGQQCQESGMACANIMCSVMERGIADGTICSRLNPFLATALVWAQSNGVITLIKVKGEHLKNMMGISVESVWEEFRTMIRRALEPTGPS